jgi:hypothetical protein
MAQTQATPFTPQVVPFQPNVSHAFAPWPAPRSLGQTFSGYVEPEELHKLLAIAPFVRLRFASDKKLNSYRANLYKVNTQGKFRYATRREGWSNLIVLRLR